MFCYKCGQELPEHSLACFRCGSQLARQVEHLPLQAVVPEPTKQATATEKPIIIKQSSSGAGLVLAVVLTLLLAGGGFYLYQANEARHRIVELRDDGVRGGGGLSSIWSSGSSAGGGQSQSNNLTASPDLAKDIVGSWETSINDKILTLNFSSDKTFKSIVDSEVQGYGTYRVINEKTIETRSPVRDSIETVPIKIEGDKMTMTTKNRNLIFTKQ